MSKKSIRFGIKTECGKRASTWNCTVPKGVGKNDIYILNRALGGTIKTSLHESGQCHTAFIGKFYNENFAEVEKDERGRFVQKWSKPNELAEGLTLVFRIVTPSSSANKNISDETHKEIFWIPNAPENMATEIDIIITTPDVLVSGWPGGKSMGTQLIGKLELDNGDTVWFVYMYTEMPKFPERMSGELRLFNDESIDEIKNGNLKAMLFGDNPDGSKVIYDVVYGDNGN